MYASLCTNERVSHLRWMRLSAMYASLCTNERCVSLEVDEAICYVRQPMYQ